MNNSCRRVALPEERFAGFVPPCQTGALPVRMFFLSKPGNMAAIMDNLKELRTIEELGLALEQSSERPVLLFKHSLTCPISARAFNEFRSFLKQADSRVSYNLITVQTARAVSNEVAARLKVAHESPQAILVRDGREVWNASHFAINESALAQAIRSISD
jgi:bacillithiol system protein YtxJ